MSNDDDSRHLGTSRRRRRDRSGFITYGLVKAFATTLEYGSRMVIVAIGSCIVWWPASRREQRLGESMAYRHRRGHGDRRPHPPDTWLHDAPVVVHGAGVVGIEGGIIEARPH